VLELSNKNGKEYSQQPSEPCKYPQVSQIVQIITPTFAFSQNSPGSGKRPLNLAFTKGCLINHNANNGRPPFQN